MGLFFLLKGLRFAGRLYLLGAISILLHELANGLAALMTGMKIRKVSLGHEGIPGFRIGNLFVSPLLLPAYVEIEDRKGSGSHIRLGLFYFSGPFMSLCLMLFFIHLHHPQGVLINLLLLVFSLLPYPKEKTDMSAFLSCCQGKGKKQRHLKT